MVRLAKTVRVLPQRSAKRAAAATPIDVPLHSVLNESSFDHVDTATLTLHDAPTTTETRIALALAERGRPLARITQQNWAR